MHVFFFFQAEDGIRDADVTGVQTCALPISYAMTGLDVPNGSSCGRAPMPALFWLHQSPRNGRWSILFAATYATAVVGELFSAVGRWGPPQPSREVSMRNRLLEGNPADTSVLYIWVS